jgi:uncharacterized membrane protein
MRKKEFLEELKEYLVGISSEEKEDILQDYEEHFKIGKKNKRTESEIIKSLGDPKEIARETRRELSRSKNPELKSEAIETWVASKKFTSHLWVTARDKISDVIQKDKKNKNNVLPNFILGGLILLAFIVIFNSWVFWVAASLIIAYLFYDYFKNNSTSKAKTKKPIVKTSEKVNKGKTNTSRLIVSLIFNLIFFIWFWIGIGAGILSLFIASIALIIAGIAVITTSVFILVVHSTPLTSDLLFAVFFSGIGVVIFGGLFTDFIGWILKIYLKATRDYIELNGRFIRK